MVFLKKWMNIFTGDLYSMYVVLKGIASLPCIRVWCYIRNSRWGVATLDVWNSSTRTFQQKTGPPKWPISFYNVFEQIFFQAHWRVPPTTGVVELWQKQFCNEHQRKWVVFLEKWMNIFTGDLYYMYAILQGIGSLSCIMVIIYYIHNSLWGAATLDVWSS